MDKEIMKMYKAKLIPLIVTFVLGFGTHALIASLTNNANADTAVQCPTNSYRIAGTETEPVCKQNPTGCPYSENTPIDSPKCALPKEQSQTTVPTPVVEVAPITKEQSPPAVVYECK